MNNNTAPFLFLGMLLFSSFVCESVNAQDTDAATTAAGLPWFAYLIPVLGVVALAFTFWKSKWVGSQDAGNETMENIATNITEGAMSFLKAEYSVLSVFVIAVAALLGWSGTLQGDASSPLIARD